jgi:7-cyano-7-deazaguanine synthase in queuosine biosynthesis
MLSAAVGEAVKLGVERLIWPVRVGEQFDRMSSVMEAMVLLEHVAEMETGRRIRVETPLLELTARQLIETGHHMAVPWRLARSCELPMEDPCGQCAGCTARKVAFEEAALDDPLMQTA